MSIVQQNVASSWSLLNLVNRVRNECGIESVPSNAAAYDFRSVTVTNALNAACQEIWRKVRWPWTKQRTSINWVAGQSEYNHPNRFMRAAVPPVARPGSRPMDEVTPEEWPLVFGDPVPYPQGTPSLCTFYQNFMKVYPAPSADFVAAYPTATLEWFKDAPPRVVDDSDGIELPAPFIEATVAYAKWKLKLHVGDSDWQTERDEYNRILLGEMSRYHVGRRMNRMVPDDDTTSLWG